jgi:hemerythrin superfamily protein
MATPRAPNKTNTPDAIDLLMSDHKSVQQMFKQFDALKEDGDDDQKSALVSKICLELTVHAQIEEEIFYPAVRDAIEDSDLMDEAEVEHAGAKDLIAQLENADTDEEFYDAKVTVLGENINHHVKEEQDEMFPKVRKAKVDTAALGARMFQRKQELMAELSGKVQAVSSSGSGAKVKKTAMSRS